MVWIPIPVSCLTKEKVLELCYVSEQNLMELSRSFHACMEAVETMTADAEEAEASEAVFSRIQHIRDDLCQTFSAKRDQDEAVLLRLLRQLR